MPDAAAMLEEARRSRPSICSKAMLVAESRTPLAGTAPPLACDETHTSAPSTSLKRVPGPRSRKWMLGSLDLRESSVLVLRIASERCRARAMAQRMTLTRFAMLGCRVGCAESRNVPATKSGRAEAAAIDFDAETAARKPEPEHQRGEARSDPPSEVFATDAHGSAAGVAQGQPLLRTHAHTHICICPYP